MKTVTTNKEEIRGLGYINVTQDHNIIAKIPYSLPGFELPGDMSYDEANIIAQLFSRMIASLEETYKSGDKFKVITMPDLGVLKVDLTVSNGVVSDNGRFYKYESIEKV